MSAEARGVRIKVCGITRPADAELAVSLGADLLGLNFWPGSPRCLDLGAAREIAAQVRGRVELVGVFVNQKPATIESLAAEVGLDLVQLHGDEGPETVAACGSRALKAIRFAGTPDAGLFAPYRRAWGFLVEARRAAGFGGLGRSWDYALARSLVAGPLAGRPLLIAGGLTPENVRAAIAASRAWGVDVASGVESSPGIKDRISLERFFAEARHGGE